MMRNIFDQISISDIECYPQQLILIQGPLINQYQLLQILALSLKSRVKMFDDLTSFVIDIGNHSAKLGYGGDDSPKVICPSYIASKVTMAEEQKDIMVGEKYFNLDKTDLEIDSIFKKKGDILSHEIVESNYESFLSFLLNKQFRLNTQDYSLLFSEDPSLKPNEVLSQRKKIAEITFEKFGAPNIFFLKSPVLACFATGRSTAMVVDSGENITRINSVHDGFVLNKNSKIINHGGQQLNREYKECVQKKIGKTLETRFSLNGSKYTQSFLEYHQKCLIQDIKASCANNPSSPQQNQESLDKFSYELPDRQTIQIQKNQIRDIFISPAEQSQSVPTSIVQMINNADVDIKKELYSNILLTGGNFMYNGNGLQNQLISKVLGNAPPNVKVKSVSLSLNSERKYLNWIGGSIVSCLSAFQSYWIGREEYLSGGASVLEKKCL